MPIRAEPITTTRTSRTIWNSTVRFPSARTASSERADRHIIERLSRRPFRDRVFYTGIKRAYDNTCAISGLRIINGGGRAEAQAAHIRPVHANGPDSLRNGIALSSTFHWMFDCGLISINDDYSLLLKRNAVPGNATGGCGCRSRRSTGRIDSSQSIIGSRCSRG